MGVNSTATVPITMTGDDPSDETIKMPDEDDRDREQGFDEPADDLVDPAAVVPHEQAEQGAGDDADERRDRCRDQHVLAPAITRERTSRPSWSVPIRFVEFGRCNESNCGRRGRMRRDPVTADGAHDPEQQDDDPDDEARAVGPATGAVPFGPGAARSA